MQKKSFLKVIFIFLLVALLLGIFLYDQNTKLYSGSQFAMDTFMSYKLCGINAQKTIDEIKTYVSDLDKKLSLYSEQSEVSKINGNAGKDFVKVSNDTFEIISYAKKLCSESNGSFDITIAPLTKLWNIMSENPKVPDAQEIDAKKELVNFNDIILDESTTSVKLLKEGQAIDLGGIAKGYVCQKVVEICKRNGVKSGIISIGGNIAILGKESIDVSITIPERNKEGTFAKVQIKNTIIATSGGYERYFEENGIIYEHIIDPSSGFPAESDLISVSVISNDGIITDAMSTRFYIEGLESVKKNLNDDSIGIIAVDCQKNVYVSKWLKEFVILNEQFPEYNFAE